MSGVDVGHEQIRKGATNAIEKYIESNGGSVPAEIRNIVDEIAVKGDTPLVVASNTQVLGVIR